MGSKFYSIQTGRTVMQVMLLAVLVCVLVACSDGADPVVSTTDVVPTRTLVPPTATPTPPSGPTTPTPTDLPGPDALRPTESVGGDDPLSVDAIVAQALDALLDSQRIESEDVRLMSLDAVVWPDAAWGCAADADRVSADDEEVPGYRIVFGAGTRVFVVHTDEYGELRLCEDRQWLMPQGDPILTDPIAQDMVDLSRRDAARQLDVTPDDLQLANVLTLTWPDASIGCPKAGVDYDDRETPGYRIVFLLDGDPVIYHASARDVMRCTPDEEILPGALRRALPDADEAGAE